MLKNDLVLSTEIAVQKCHVNYFIWKLYKAIYGNYSDFATSHSSGRVAMIYGW